MSATASQFLSKNEQDLFTVLDQAIEYWSMATGKPPSHIGLYAKQWRVLTKLAKKLEKGPVFNAENVVPVIAPTDPPCVLYRGVELTSPQPTRLRSRRSDTDPMF